MVAAAKRNVRVPVLIKVSANWPNLAGVLAACLDAGADYFFYKATEFVLLIDLLKELVGNF